MTKISIICVTRNDNYGMHQEARTKVFLNGLKQIPNKEIYELIFVEWNQLPDSLSFYEQYKEFFPKDLRTKIITVPKEVHNNLVGSSVINVFEYHGKNVGARNSSGSYLIFTNPDNFFFPELWKHVEENISEEYFLRLCRYDVRIPYVGNIDVDMINGRTLIENPLHFYSVPNHPMRLPLEYLELDKGFEWEINHEGASGDFLGVSKKNFEKINGYIEHYTYGGFDGIIMRDLINEGVKQFILPTFSIHIDHSRQRPIGSRPTELESNFVKTDDWGLLNNESILVQEV
jgi:hypothetical protein